MQSTITFFISQIDNDENHRFTSWENCYKAFQETLDRELLSLNLAFYLASWGMYRGSSGLLQKNHKIHLGAVDIILKYKFLQCTNTFEVSRNDINAVLELVRDLENHYREIIFSRNSKSLNVAPTLTLISKIILGTLGCLPAFDRYFIDGAKNKGYSFNNFSRNTFEYLFDFVENNASNEILKNQKNIESKREMYYPKMKVIDMYFWQIGYDYKK